MFDFKRLTEQSPLYNFHSHTQFCDGKATMAEFAAEAVRQGFVHYGYSPHSPIAIDSPCNMGKEDVAKYLKELERIKNEYAGSGTHFYASMEIDYLNDEHGPSAAYYQDIPLDYRIGSVHFIPTREGEYVDIDGRFETFRKKMAQYFHNDIRYVVNTFYDQTLEMVSRGGFDLIAHFDKIGHNASQFQPGIEGEQWYIDRRMEATRAIIASGVAIEINTKAWAEHTRMFPSPELWPLLVESGATIVIDSDAHRPELINASREEAMRMLEAMRKA